jgi:hypothetical protein
MRAIIFVLALTAGAWSAVQVGLPSNLDSARSGCRRSAQRGSTRTSSLANAMLFSIARTHLPSCAVVGVGVYFWDLPIAATRPAQLASRPL